MDDAMIMLLAAEMGILPGVLRDAPAGDVLLLWEYRTMKIENETMQARKQGRRR